MNKIFPLLCFICSLVSFKGISQNTVIPFDSISIFHGDVQAGVYTWVNRSMLLKIKSDDSTFLYKVYSHGKLIHAYQCDLSGRMTGNSYFQDTMTGNITRSRNLRGKTLELCTTTSSSDTVLYIIKVNDTLLNWKEKKNAQLKMWQTDTNNIYNGYYQAFDSASGVLLTEGHYKAICESEIKDKKKYKQLLGKYKLTYWFRGENESQQMAEIPVGTWYFYTINGKLKEKIAYDWKGVF